MNFRFFRIYDDVWLSKTSYTKQLLWLFIFQKEGKEEILRSHEKLNWPTFYYISEENVQ